MSKVQARLLKGFRDYLPDVELARQQMLATVENVFESYGFGPLTTPAIEYAEVLLGKYGAEGDKLLYRFEDNGGRDVALRYDLTVPLARVVAQNLGQLPLPFRRYQIAPVWRAEKPGRGRFREFVQCDVDIVGSPSIRADAECMLVGLGVLDALRVPDAVMRVNNRKILDGLMDACGVEGKAARHDVLRVVDKLPKIGRDGVTAESAGLGLTADATARLFETLEREVKSAADLAALTPLVGATEAGALGIAELTELLEIVEAAGQGAKIEVDLSIARGLDYYTGTIYETFLRGHEGYGSVMSGGRYDTLLDMFLKQPVPAVGISLGVDRLLAALLDLKLVTSGATAAHAFVALFDAADYGANVQLAQILRAHGVKTELALKPQRFGKQLKLAERKGYRWVIIAGSAEQAAGTVNIKDMVSGEQTTRAVADIADWAGSLTA